MYTNLNDKKTNQNAETFIYPNQNSLIMSFFCFFEEGSCHVI
jgi:hypothetical protein